MIKIRTLIIVFSFLCSSLLGQESMTHTCETGNSKIVELDFETAVFRTLNRALPLDIASAETEAKRSLIKQAKLYPNPSLSYEVEDFAGNRKWRGWDHREERYFWSQLFETGGKRNFRIQAASYEYYAALVGYDVSKLVILNNLSKAFIQVVAAQELLKVASDQAKIAEEVLYIASKKVEAGKVALIQQNKAEVAYSNALIAVEQAKTQFKNAKRRLALQWASTCPDFERVSFPFFEIASPIPFEQCLANLCDQPEIVQALYAYWNAHQTWRLEKANRIPDVTLQVGYKANYEEKNQGLMAGISMPIPIFNRNQGNIRRAYFDMLKTGDQGRQLWLVLEAKLAISYEDLIRAYEDAERIKNISLPAATQAFELAQKGYRAGKFEYLDVLDAQRTLFEEREKYIQTLVNYHNRRADIDYLNSQTN
jgi:cobalt-zinc-cadmium efflux system outer membrane protein